MCRSIKRQQSFTINHLNLHLNLCNNHFMSLVQFQESALTKLSACSRINTQPPYLVKCINEVRVHFQHQWICIKEKSNHLKEWVLEITRQYFWTQKTVKKKNRKRIQESKQMFTSISTLSLSIYLIIWEKLSCIAVWLHVHFANFQMYSNVLIYIMALYFRSLWFPNHCSYFSKHQKKQKIFIHLI